MVKMAKRADRWAAGGGKMSKDTIMVQLEPSELLAVFTSDGTRHEVDQATAEWVLISKPIGKPYGALSWVETTDEGQVLHVCVTTKINGYEMVLPANW